MRMLLKFVFDTEAASESIRTGEMAEVNRTLAENTRPEAAYYGTENGKRTGYIFFDLEDPSQIPVIAEPLFQRVKATVEFIPVMNDDDLQRGLAAAAAGNRQTAAV
jgi:hypothetical protein